MIDLLNALQFLSTYEVTSEILRNIGLTFNGVATLIT